MKINIRHSINKVSWQTSCMIKVTENYLIFNVPYDSTHLILFSSPLPKPYPLLTDTRNDFEIFLFLPHFLKKKENKHYPFWNFMVVSKKKREIVHQSCTVRMYTCIQPKKRKVWVSVKRNFLAWTKIDDRKKSLRRESFFAFLINSVMLSCMFQIQKFCLAIQVSA